MPATYGLLGEDQKKELLMKILDKAQTEFLKTGSFNLEKACQETSFLGNTWKLTTIWTWMTQTDWGREVRDQWRAMISDVSLDVLRIHFSEVLTEQVRLSTHANSERTRVEAFRALHPYVVAAGIIAPPEAKDVSTTTNLLLNLFIGKTVAVRETKRAEAPITIDNDWPTEVEENAG